MLASKKPAFLHRTTVTDSAVTYLREEIVTGRLLPGEALPEAQVGKLLGVSRAPVREALTLLEREGLVSFDRRGTAHVCAFGPDDIRELGLMRQALEPAAARLVCQRRPVADDLAALEENQRRLKQAVTLDDVTRLDVEFHRLVVVAAGNRRLLAAWDALEAQFQVVMRAFHQSIERRAPRRVRGVTWVAHFEILAALKGDNPEQAAALAAHHARSWLVELEEGRR